MKRFLQRTVGIAAAALLLPFATAGQAVLAETTADTAVCHAYTGTNEEAQNYMRWAQTMQSFLTPCSDGTLMQVQADLQEGYYIAQYYSSDFQPLCAVRIAQELPLFGGFYAAGDAYYILTGQSQATDSSGTREEDDDLEVFRVTKYDKNWNRLGSCGVYGADTTVPFSAGSARMTDDGTYLLVRTCHEMYNSGGVYHQSNFTFQVNMAEMTVTDYFTDTKNMNHGYVSHSFNQFLQMDNGTLVTADHGDAYGRGVIFMRYPTDISAGTFQSNGVEYLQTLVPAGSGNGTGISVGGFSCMDDQYLIAYNAVDDAEERTTYAGEKRYHYFSGSKGSFDGKMYTLPEYRNICFSMIDKKDGSYTNYQCTEYTEADGKSASTPQLVTLENGKFVLLWSEMNVVRTGEYIGYSGYNNYYSYVPNHTVYAMISDGDDADTVCFEGDLSDCQPVVYQGNVVWYVRNGDQATFYQLTPDGEIQTKTAGYSHICENGSGTCVVCGEEVQQPPESVAGDVNGDGVFDGQDAAILQEFLLGESPVMENPSRADWNGDGTLDAFDLALMRQALCGNHEE